VKVSITECSLVSVSVDVVNKVERLNISQNASITELPPLSPDAKMKSLKASKYNLLQVHPSYIAHG
jgi:hypothetical protein